MHTTWRVDRDPASVLDLLQQRLEDAGDVASVDRDGNALLVRSRGVPMRAYLLSLVLTPLPIKSVVLRARTDRLLRISAVGHADGGNVELDGDTNAAVSQVLVATAHELFPAKVAAWDDD